MCFFEKYSKACKSIYLSVTSAIGSEDLNIIVYFIYVSPFLGRYPS